MRDIFTPEQKGFETEDYDQCDHNDDQKKEDVSDGYIYP